MVFECFKFIFSCIGKYLSMLGSIELWSGFSLLGFLIAVAFFPIVLKLLSVIRAETIDTFEEDVNFDRRMERYENYKIRKKRRGD